MTVQSGGELSMSEKEHLILTLEEIAELADSLWEWDYRVERMSTPFCGVDVADLAGTAACAQAREERQARQTGPAGDFG